MQFTEWLKIVPEKVHNRYQEAFPFQENSQTLEWVFNSSTTRSGQRPQPVSVSGHMNNALNNIL